jgi:hypothetical protein
LITTTGLPEKIQTVNGPVLLRDAGLIVLKLPSQATSSISPGGSSSAQHPGAEIVEDA